MTRLTKYIVPALVTLLASTASADSTRAHYRADGTVKLGNKIFPTYSAYLTSPGFQQGGRCGSVVGPQVSLASENDCSGVHTTINPEYNDGRVLVVQVVFHVIKNTAGEGAISNALINSQIDVLNEDFQALAGTPGAPGADSKVEFVLARFDPDGMPTTGINVVTNNNYFTDPGSGGGVNDMKQALHWDTSRYLNIYTNDAHGDLLGYATFPTEEAGGPEDGVVLLWAAVGYNSPSPPYDLGRTATHEVGHYLGLYHTFQGGCAGGNQYNNGDLIADTQSESGPHFSGCVAGASDCGGGLDPIENYMDYSDDLCMNNFSVEQSNRIRCSIVNYRTVNTKPIAAFTHSETLLAATFNDDSTDAETPTQLHYAWNFGDGMTSTQANPSHSYAAAGTYTVTLEVVDPNSGASEVTDEVTVVDGTPDAAPPEPDADPDSPDAEDPGNPGDGDGGGCCQTNGGGAGFLLCGLPVLLVLRRRRRARV